MKAKINSLRQRIENLQDRIDELEQSPDAESEAFRVAYRNLQIRAQTELAQLVDRIGRRSA